MPEQRNAGSEAMPQTKTKNGNAHEVSVGLMSRVCYGSPGFRMGLLEAGRKKFEEAGTHFDILVGGLVSGRDLKARIKTELSAARKKFLAEERKARAAEKKAREAERRKGAVKNKKGAVAKKDTAPTPEKKHFEAAVTEEAILDRIAHELADCIPHRVFPGTKKPVKLYIMVSPLPAYDGEYGARIAEKLALLRSDDITFLVNPDEQLPFKPPPHPDFQDIACLVPVTSTFKAVYDSAPIDYMVKDYISRASKMPANVIMVGCCGSHVYIPKGERNKQAVISIPNLHKTQYKTSKSENQIGVVVARFTTDGELFVANENCNDGVLYERNSIAISDKYTKSEQEMLELFRDVQQTWWTAGLIKDRLVNRPTNPVDVPRDEIEKTLQRIVKKSDELHIKPPISYDGPRSGRYYIDSRWLEKNLRYPWPEAPFNVDRILYFACLHALSTKTDHRHFVNEVPRLMLKLGANILVGAGDFIEGREHGLADQGAVIAGADYTQQEMFAAWSVAEALLRVFDQRFEKIAQNSKLLNIDEVLSAIKSALPFFVYRPGNHCEWTQKHAVRPLKTFHMTLVDCLIERITDAIAKKKLPLPANLGAEIRKKVIRKNESELPSGVTLRLDHLHKGGAKTKTLHNQELLGARAAQLIIHGNFHTFSMQTRFDPFVGQRAVCEAGTEKRNHPESSDFESNLGKVVDPGVGYVEVWTKGRRIVRIVNAHFAPTGPFKLFDNEDLLRAFAKDIGIRQFASCLPDENNKLN